MNFKIYNTLTRSIEVFNPIKKGEVGMYTCGPTVYDYAHIGNFRAYIVSDLLKRYLKYKGYRVKQVMNLTDVDDKTIRNSREQGIPLQRYTAKYKKAFFEDLGKLNIEPADVFPEATQHIPEMLAIIKKLYDKKLAYVGEDSCVYFSIKNFKNYGKLSHLKIDELKAGARIRQDEYEKESAHDFALWKAWDEGDGDVVWDSEFGRGRPGWHIECSAMSMKYLGETFDIHAGGIDLIFPHHENEIAQSEGATGLPFVRYWVHNEWLLVNGKKMSKSLGNFYTLRDLTDKQGRDPKAIRYLLMSTHYRAPLNFTLDGIEAADTSVKRLNDFIIMLNNVKAGKENPDAEKLTGSALKGFEEAMDNDLNISQALGVIFDYMKSINKIEIGKKDAEKIIEAMNRFDSVLGVLKKEEVSLDREVEEKIREREKARKKKDFAKADAIRGELDAKGIILEDTPEGVRWKIK
jgi:cysteinyl-tRNA synthetase